MRGGGYNRKARQVGEWSRKLSADSLSRASSQVSVYVHLFRDGANVVPNLKVGSKGDEI